MARTKKREPLNRERVLQAAMKMADEAGLESLSMRKLGEAVGVKAMSLYNHVANKEEVLDGLIEMVVSEWAEPPEDLPWKDAMRVRSRSVREALVRHPWAAPLIESRMTPSLVRFQHNDAVVGTLRRAGFTIEQCYHAFIVIDSFIYGFVLQEVSWPFGGEDEAEIAGEFEPLVDPSEYPHLMEMIGFVMAGGPSRHHRPRLSYEFDFGLNMLLDGFERELKAVSGK